MRRWCAGLLLCLLAVAACSGGASGRDGSDRAEDLSSTVWLCRPDLASNPCGTDRTATAVAFAGNGVPERAAPAAAPVDCFYVYPEVSDQTTANASLAIDPPETAVAIAEASRFSGVCRVFAPVYRQWTLAAEIGGEVTQRVRDTAYADVLAAWRDYLAHDNGGRGVVLIGHGEGAELLVRLIRQEVEPRPAVLSRLVSAILPGGNVLVPAGKDVGGDFTKVPACRLRGQTGCVVAYSAYDATPPPGSVYGRAPAGEQVLCVNPAAPTTNAESWTSPYFPVTTALGSLGGYFPTGSYGGVTTPWITYPVLFTAQCRSSGGASWLQVDERQDTADRRPRLIDTLGPYRGLQLLDVDVALGDLTDLVTDQSASWAGSH